MGNISKFIIVNNKLELKITEHSYGIPKINHGAFCLSTKFDKNEPNDFNFDNRVENSFDFHISDSITLKLFFKFLSFKI